MKKLLNVINNRRIYKAFIAGCTHLTNEEPTFLDYNGMWDNNHYSTDETFANWNPPMFLDYTGEF